MAKKFTRIVSQSTRRVLETAASTCWPATSKARLQRYLGRPGRQPAALLDLVGRGHLVAIGQVELAVYQPLGAGLFVVVRSDRLAVDGDQPPTHHRRQGDAAQAFAGQRIGHGLALVRLHVDQEAVGRIRRHSALPTLDQVGARHRQQQQRHQADRQRADLRDGGRPPAHHPGQRKAQRGQPRGQAAHARQAQDAQPRHQCEDGESAQKAPRHHAAQLRVAGEPPDQQGKARRAQRVAEGAAGADRVGVAPQHPRRRHMAHLCQGG
ncbi:hypothetical protein G6F57_018360 [Rhizopus arrhizus]|nr:hypothetical protein G6F57_018360 [Rhizopus arrhizus]